jgi:hypothetical protein
MVMRQAKTGKKKLRLPLRPPAPTAPAPAASALKAIEAIPQDKCVDAGDGYVLATIDDHPDVKRSDGSPAQVGDVMSVQPDGTIQARPAGSRGAYELAKPSGNWLVYRPINGGRCWWHPLATEWPNV